MEYIIVWCTPELFCIQWLCHWGVKGAECLDSEKICQNLGKRGRKSGKSGKKLGKEEKSGSSFTLPLLTDRAGYAAVCIMCLYLQLAGLKQALPAGHSTHDP